MGITVVANDVNDPRDSVLDGTNGILVKILNLSLDAL
jgi:hypothetical protein